jgi:hypothetical protein
VLTTAERVAEARRMVREAFAAAPIDEEASKGCRSSIGSDCLLRKRGSSHDAVADEHKARPI